MNQISPYKHTLTIFLPIKKFKLTLTILFPHSINPSIDLSQLQKETSIQQHLLLSQQKRLPQTSLNKQAFIQQAIQHTSEGSEVREIIQNTMDAQGHLIHLSYKQVQHKDSTGQIATYLCECIEDNSQAPETLVQLLIPNYSTKRKHIRGGQPFSPFRWTFWKRLNDLP